MTRASLPGRRRVDLGDGWELSGSVAGRIEDPAGLDALEWQAARVPGTVAGVLGDDAMDLDARDWWFRLAFAAEPADAGEEVVLHLDGVATVAEVYLNGKRVLDSESMFAAHEVDVGASLRGDNELVICCRALAPLLEIRRRPRARWRTRLVAAGNLRFYRTMLLGRAPGFAPGPTVVGPWRPVWLERRCGLVLEAARVRAQLQGDAGMLRFSATLRALPGARLPAALPLAVAASGGRHEADARVLGAPGGAGIVGGSVIVPEVEPWWPCTHGSPVLYGVELDADAEPAYRGRVGFRSLQSAPDLAADGPALRVNGVALFCRGAVWTPLSLRDPQGTEPELARVLQAASAAGMNMLRVPGIGAYESDTFYDLCDALGILVWQDFMFANLDYPDSDPAFMDVVEREARALLHRLAPRPSLAVVCGGSEVAQQVAMMGLEPALAEGPLYGELLPRLVREAEVEAPYLPSSPWGGELPFRTDAGVANYYGVGAYLRPLTDARLAQVRFAGESLAFANVPDDAGLEQLAGGGGLAVNGPEWKAAVPRDVGAGWDFDDVRDHYLRTLFKVDPVALRHADSARYLELSRAVSGEVMAETFGEWRRTGSPCRGALVLWLKDLRPGAGWGVLDHRGEPKVAFRHLARALAPVAVWSTDEGLGGLAVHVANDRSDPLAGRLRVALYRDFEQLVAEEGSDLSVEPHGSFQSSVEALLGRFVDVSWAYRFGPPAQDLIAVSLERDGELISQAFRFPVRRPVDPEPLSRIGLRGRLARSASGGALTVASDRFAYGVRVTVPGYTVSDDAFGVEPGHERVLALTAVGESEWPPKGATLTALNLSGSVRVSVDGES